MSPNRRFRGSPGRHQGVSISLDEKLEYPAHIQSLGTRRGAPRDQFRRDGTAATLSPAIEDRLHFHDVLGHHHIGEQAQRIGNGLHFILALGLMAGDSGRVPQALQGVVRFAAIEDAEDLAPEYRIDEVIGQEHGAQQASDGRRRPHRADPHVRSYPAAAKQVIRRFYQAESRYMQNAGRGTANFEEMRETLSPAVTLHQSPDFSFRGEYVGPMAMRAGRRR